MAQFLKRERERESSATSSQSAGLMTAPLPRNHASPQSPPDRPPFPKGGCPSFNSNLRTFALTVPAKAVRHPFVHAMRSLMSGNLPVSVASVAALIHTTGRGPPPVL